jgi:hypothetical protein
MAMEIYEMFKEAFGDNGLDLPKPTNDLSISKRGRYQLAVMMMSIMVTFDRNHV